MNCSKCGTFNSSESKFCISCGNQLQNLQDSNNIEQTSYEQPVVNEPIIENNNYQQVVQETKINTMPANNTVTYNATSNVASTGVFNFFAYIIAAILKPFQAFKEEEEKLGDIKNSAILTAIIAGVMMLASFMKTAIDAVFVKTYSFSTTSPKTEIVFANLKKLDYIDLIFKNFLIFAGIILAIAVIYYLAGLVMKKEVNFQKMLSISATTMIPFAALGTIVSPLLGIIWSYLEVIAFIIGIIYSVVILVSLMKKQISFDKEDINIYFHTTCLSILLFAGYCIFIKYIQSVITAGLGNILGS